MLVATTIIENGIDIPRANTIIINRADNYVFPSCYQLAPRRPLEPQGLRLPFDHSEAS